MSSFAITRHVFCSLPSKEAKHKTLRKKLITTAALALTVFAAVQIQPQVEQFVLDEWNAKMVEYGIVRPAVEIDVSNPVFFDAVVEWAHKRNGGSTQRDLIAKFVTIAFAESANQRVDPLLTLAVIATESRFEFMAESHAGAKGLMQIIPFWHRDKIAVAQVFDPVTNIKAGTKILHEYTAKHRGNLNKALLSYNGSLELPGSNYDTKVLSTRADLHRHIEKAFIRDFKQKYDQKA